MAKDSAVELARLGVKVRARKDKNLKRICRRKSGRGWKVQSKRAAQYR